MQKTSELRLSNVSEQILLANCLRYELIDSLRIYSKYQKKLANKFNKHNLFARKVEMVRFQKYLSVCLAYLDTWHTEINNANSLMISFLSRDLYLPLLDEFLNLHEDFPAQYNRFEEITYACLDILGESNKDLNIYIIPFEEAFEIFLNSSPVKSDQIPVNSIWSETAFLIFRAENLEEELFNIVRLLQDMETTLLESSSENLKHFLPKFEQLSDQAINILSDINDVHDELNNKLTLFNACGKLETDKTKPKFDQHFDALYQPEDLTIALEAIMKTCAYLIECSEIISTRKASDF
ncbi:MAG: hypothetical protein ACM3KR_10205 [Deltaproteobacteria bacterium]